MRAQRVDALLGYTEQVRGGYDTAAHFHLISRPIGGDLRALIGCHRPPGAVDWTNHEERVLRLLRRYYGAHGFRLEPDRNPHGFADAMQRYFAGDLGALDALPVATSGTAFQREVWQALRGIPLGKTMSYGDLARQIGKPRTIRAVGLARVRTRLV